MPATLAELLTAVTVAEAESTILGLLEAVGFPATAWQRFSVPRTFVRLFAELYSDARTGLTNIVKSRLLDLCEGDALTYLASNFFEEERDPATATVGEFVLADDGGAPYDIEIGQLTVRDTVTGKRYTNITGGTLASGGPPLTLSFQAEGTGSEYNIGAGATLEFAETFEGVLVTNPAIGSTGSWRTHDGTDEQSDTSLREACRNKWATLGAGTAEAYEAWAIEGASTITKVNVVANDPGSVTVILANDTGGASTEDVDAANEVIQAKRPIGLRVVNVYGATAVPVTINATVYVRAASASTYEAGLNAARTAYQAEMKIDDELYMSKVDALLHEPGGVTRAVVTSPVGTTVADYDQIIVLTLGTITIVNV